MKKSVWRFTLAAQVMLLCSASLTPAGVCAQTVVGTTPNTTTNANGYIAPPAAPLNQNGAGNINPIPLPVTLNTGSPVLNAPGCAYTHTCLTGPAISNNGTGPTLFNSTTTNADNPSGNAASPDNASTVNGTAGTNPAAARATINEAAPGNMRTAAGRR